MNHRFTAYTKRIGNLSSLTVVGPVTDTVAEISFQQIKQPIKEKGFFARVFKIKNTRNGKLNKKLVEREIPRLKRHGSTKDVFSLKPRNWLCGPKLNQRKAQKTKEKISIDGSYTSFQNSSNWKLKSDLQKFMSQRIKLAGIPRRIRSCHTN